MRRLVALLTSRPPGSGRQRTRPDELHVTQPEDRANRPDHTSPTRTNPGRTPTHTAAWP
jgi:hypothetical protein